VSELARLIAEQQADMRRGDRVWSVSLDAFPSGPDIPRPRLLVTDDRHGTLNGYIHLRCRCDKCKAANAASSRKYARRKTAGAGDA